MDNESSYFRHRHRRRHAVGGFGELGGSSAPARRVYFRGQDVDRPDVPGRQLGPLRPIDSVVGMEVFLHPDDYTFRYITPTHRGGSQRLLRQRVLGLLAQGRSDPRSEVRPRKRVFPSLREGPAGERHSS